MAIENSTRDKPEGSKPSQQFKVTKQFADILRLSDKPNK